jgi:hypothetical protein
VDDYGVAGLWGAENLPMSANRKLSLKLSLAFVLAALASVALIPSGAAAAGAGKLTPRQAVAKCRAERKADTVAFRTEYGIGAKKRAPMARCIAAKAFPAVDTAIAALPALPALPDLTGLVPPQACSAIQSVLAALPTLDFSQLLSLQLPSLPGLSIPPQLLTQLSQLQGLLSQLQGMLTSIPGLGFVQQMLQSQLSQAAALAQQGLAVICPVVP